MLELIEFFHVSSHRCRSRQSYGGAKEFFPNSPTLARKILDLQKKLFMSIRAPCDLQKKAVHVNSGAIVFKSKHVGRHFCPDFQGVLEDSQIFCPDLVDFVRFSPNQNFWGAVAPPTFYTSVL